LIAEKIPQKFFVNVGVADETGDAFFKIDAGGKTLLLVQHG